VRNAHDRLADVMSATYLTLPLVQRRPRPLPRPHTRYHLEVRDGASVPWWFSAWIYAFVSLVGLSWLFRVAMGSVTGRRKETINKIGL
jgi:hypothetical protein